MPNNRPAKIPPGKRSPLLKDRCRPVCRARRWHVADAPTDVRVAQWTGFAGERGESVCVCVKLGGDCNIPGPRAARGDIF